MLVAVLLVKVVRCQPKIDQVEHVGVFVAN